MIELSKQAALKVKEMLETHDDPHAFLRVGVDEGGCTGFSYNMGFDSERKDSDLLVEKHEIKMLVDGKSEPLIKGTKIDYQESLMGGGFTISNPNASATCGCGASFRTAKNSGKPGDC
jgi:iron-sulfur cluster assembly protein